MKIIQKTELLRDPNLLHCKKALDIPNLGNPGDTILYYEAGLRSRSRIRSRNESDAFGWSQSRIPNTTGSRILCPTPAPDV